MPLLIERIETDMKLQVEIKKQYRDFLLAPAFVCEGRLMGILGASGCGKTLTLKSLAGLIKPDEGRIVCGEKVFFDAGQKHFVKPEERRVGYLFQNYALFPNMTVWENITAPLYKMKQAEKKERLAGAQALLERFQLEGVKDHKPHQISGGEQQRTALARMLIGDPVMCLLDEPFSALDAFLRERMRLEMMQLLQEYDKTSVLVSHDRDEVYQMCDYLILMEKGQAIRSGKTSEVFKHPGTPAAARLTGCKNISRIEWISDHQVAAVDWNNIVLAVEGKAEQEVTHIGIRAHDFVAGDIGTNAITCGAVTVSKLPFEWYVTLENGLWWKMPRGLSQKFEKGMIPDCISIPPDKIELLRG